MKRPGGNGSGEVVVAAQDMGGWVRVFTEKKNHGHPELPLFLSHQLSQFLRKMPQLTLTAVVPMCADGETVELHAWYTLHVFPDAGNVPVKQGK